MSRQRLENQAKSFLLEVDQEYEMDEILKSDKRNINGTQLIHQLNLNARNSSALNALGGWNGNTENDQGVINKINNQPKQIRNTLSRNLRAISAQNDNSPRGSQLQINQLPKQKEQEQIQLFGNLSRKNSLQMQEIKRNLNNKLQRSFDKENDQDKGKILFKLGEFNHVIKNVQSDNMKQVKIEDQQGFQNITEDDEDTLQLIGRKRQARVYNFVKQKLNVLHSPKQLDQMKLNLYDQVNQRHNSVFTPLNISKQQYSPSSHQTQQQILSPKTVSINNQFKVRIDMIQDKIQQYIDLNDKTMDAFKKITEIRRNSLLLQKTQSKQIPIQTHEFIPVELLQQQNMELLKQQREFLDIPKLKEFNEQTRLRDNVDIQKQRENYRNYLEQPGTMPLIANSNSKPLLTPRNGSSLNKNQTPQITIKAESQQNSIQTTPIKSRNYRLTPTETKRLIDHIEKQGRNYLSSSPTKTKNNGIKFRISKKQSVIEPPTIQITPSHLNSYANHNIINNNNNTILDSINFEEDNQSSSNNMKQIILQKISQQNTPNQIIDNSSKITNAYKSLKKQRILNVNNGNYNGSSNVSQIFQNSVYKGATPNANSSNNSQMLDSSQYSASIQMDNSVILPSTSPYDSNLNNIRSQNSYKVEDFFDQKQEIYTAPLKNRPRMNLQKLNKVKQMNFELENTLCKQTPVSALQNGNSFEYNHQVSLNLPSQVRMNKIMQTDSQQHNNNDYERYAQKLVPSYRQNSVEKKRIKINTQNPNQDHQFSEYFYQGSPNQPPVQLQRERIFAKSKENEQIHLNQLQQNSSRLTEKSIQLHPKNLF